MVSLGFGPELRLLASSAVALGIERQLQSW